MKKEGFTLAELLVTMAIIGVVAALCFPSLGNMVPNKKKGLYVKAYKNLAQITADLLNEPGYYWADHNDNGDITYEGLTNWTAPVPPVNIGHNAAQDASKYTILLASKLQLAGDINVSNNGGSFETIDGIEWTVEESGRGTSTKDSPNYKEEVTINLAPDSEENQCTYSATCTKPNQFKFEVDNWGGVKAADALGMVYLQNQTNLSSSKDDNNLAAQVIKKAGSATDIDKMAKALDESKNSTKSTKK